MPVQRITAREAADRLGQGWKYVDVRSVPEFESGHPAGAYNLPIMHMEPGRGMSPNPAFAEIFSRTFGKDDKLILGCKSGGRSLRAAELVASLGYSAIVDVRGGFDGEKDAIGRVVEAGWKDSDLPVESAAAPGHSWADLSK